MSTDDSATPQRDCQYVGLRPKRTWRWLIVIDDLPPMPERHEVVDGYLTRRSARHEYVMRRLALSRYIGSSSEPR